MMESRSLVLISIQTRPGRAVCQHGVEHTLRDGGRRQAGDDGVAARSDLGRRGREPRSGGDERLGELRIEVVNDEFEAGARERTGKLGPEMSQPDKPINHKRPLPL